MDSRIYGWAETQNLQTQTFEDGSYGILCEAYGETVVIHINDKLTLVFPRPLIRSSTIKNYCRRLKEIFFGVKIEVSNEKNFGRLLIDIAPKYENIMRLWTFILDILENLKSNKDYIKSCYDYSLYGFTSRYLKEFPNSLLRRELENIMGEEGLLSFEYGIGRLSIIPSWSSQSNSLKELETKISLIEQTLDLYLQPTKYLSSFLSTRGATDLISKNVEKGYGLVCGLYRDRCFVINNNNLSLLLMVGDLTFKINDIDLRKQGLENIILSLNYLNSTLEK